MSAELAASAIRGQERASKTLGLVTSGLALPDQLHSDLQQIRALGDGEMLRGFTRAIQKALELSAPRRKHERR